MKNLLITILFLSSITINAQQTSTRIPFEQKGLLLDSIFPIENIKSITITNNNGIHILSEKELTDLKRVLIKAKYEGGLIIKPGHITLKIELKDNSIIKAGFVYASIGSIHFDYGISKFKQKFSGSFKLPKRINFDNYK